MNVIEFKGPASAQQFPPHGSARRPPGAWWRRRWFKVLLFLVAFAVVALVAVTEYARHHSKELLTDLQPIIRQRLVDTLSNRFESPVELDKLNISVSQGIEVVGEGLRVQHLPGADPNMPGPPDVSVQHFEFHTSAADLLRFPTHIANVEVVGAELHIPPANQRGKLLPSAKDRQASATSHITNGFKFSLFMENISCRSARLYIDASAPGKEPLEFDIQEVHLHQVSIDKPLTYEAKLVNPKPIGDVYAAGHIGPWVPDNPSRTHLDGNYRFDHADLNTIRGIGGILSSTGGFTGQLSELIVDGETNTPDFSLDTSNHPVPLHTKFHALVDGTSGDTYLQPVQAHLLHSDFTARGKVVKVSGKGHDILLDVDMPKARMEDMLQLAVKTNPPLMRGVLHMNTRLHIPPGKERVMGKLDMQGTFALDNVSFSNPDTQNKVDGMSARAQGKPKDVDMVANDQEVEAKSSMKARFMLLHGMIHVDDLNYQVPGALALMNGVYSTDGNVFEFKGHVRTDATASHMVTGWKSWLLKPIDPFLKKNGAGLELPVSVSGTQGDVHFGLAMHGSANQSSAELAQDLKNKKQGMLDSAKAKREKEKADAAKKKADASSGAEKTRAEKKAEKERQKAERHAAAADAVRHPD